jgi:hypothetical protein
MVFDEGDGMPVQADHVYLIPTAFMTFIAPAV